MRLNPHHPDFYSVALMDAHLFKGEYEQALVEALKSINPPDFYWWHANRAVVYGHLGRRTEAQAEIATLMKVYPDFPKRARQEMRIWFLDENHTEQFLNGLRKAGLEIPPES